MSAALRKCVVLGPLGVIAGGGSQSYLFAPTRDAVRASRSGWLRLWADWPSLQPAPGAFDLGRLDALDRQIAQAKADGLRVILTLYRFPPWANGTAGVPPDPGDPRHQAFAPHDRRERRQPPDRLKELALRWPEDLSASGPWGTWLRFLAQRYHRFNPLRPYSAWIDALEFVNEPNLQPWPQQAPAAGPDPYALGAPIAHLRVRDMWAAAAAVCRELGGHPWMVGPGTADLARGSRLRTAQPAFTAALLSALEASGFQGSPSHVWSTHNYHDVVAGTGHVGQVRRQLAGRWRGWPAGDPADPQVWITEGGAEVHAIAKRLHIPLAARGAVAAAQARLLAGAGRRLQGGPEGEGVAMMAQYLVFSSPVFDSGLRDPYEPGQAAGQLQAGGAPRAAEAAWRGLAGDGQ